MHPHEGCQNSLISFVLFKYKWLTSNAIRLRQSWTQAGSCKHSWDGFGLLIGPLEWLLGLRSSVRTTWLEVCDTWGLLGNSLNLWVSSGVGWCWPISHQLAALWQPCESLNGSGLHRPFFSGARALAGRGHPGNLSRAGFEGQRPLELYSAQFLEMLNQRDRTRNIHTDKEEIVHYWVVSECLTAFGISKPWGVSPRWSCRIFLQTTSTLERWSIICFKIWPSSRPYICQFFLLQTGKEKDLTWMLEQLDWYVSKAQQKGLKEGSMIIYWKLEVRLAWNTGKVGKRLSSHFHSSGLILILWGLAQQKHQATRATLFPHRHCEDPSLRHQHFLCQTSADIKICHLAEVSWYKETGKGSKENKELRSLLETYYQAKPCGLGGSQLWTDSGLFENREDLIKPQIQFISIVYIYII